MIRFPYHSNLTRVRIGNEADHKWAWVMSKFGMQHTRSTGGYIYGVGYGTWTWDYLDRNNSSIIKYKFMFSTKSDLVWYSLVWE